ncbi:exopolysaccharide biosynthesis polyprenyl glycosylphosphotransferase, partial [Mangrovicoccus algicola]
GLAGIGALALGPLLALRLAARAFLRWAVAFGALQRRAIIAGGGAAAEVVIRALEGARSDDIRIVALFDDRGDSRSPQQVLGVPRIGSFWHVLSFVAQAEIDMVIIALPLEAEDRIRWLLAAFKALPHQIHLAGFQPGGGFRDGRAGGLILARQASYGTGRRWRKRAFDLLFGSLALLLLSPVMAAAALAIRLDSPGPVFFTQWRHGLAGRHIPVLKFRSMYHDRADHGGTRVVRRGGDARVTRVGAFLRRSSIDELPQLFGVLRGDLSLVGPRPHALDARSAGMDPFAELVEDYASRHRLPPGLTGWAQINGLRGGIDAPEQLRARVAHDLYYIENWSLWFDLRILLRTPLALLDTRNAY